MFFIKLYFINYFKQNCNNIFIFQASTLLDENHATYPEKILYTSPQHLAVEALELHYRIHASVLKYLELHEGKEITSSLGAFFKKCLNSSKFLQKPTPKPAPETPVKVSESSFQEQFLNSLNKMREEEPNKAVEEEKVETENKIVPEDNTSGKSSPKAKSTVTDQENIVKEFTQLAPKPIVEDDDVIMISDSDDEKSTANNTNIDIKKEGRKKNC